MAEGEGRAQSASLEREHGSLAASGARPAGFSPGSFWGAVAWWMTWLGLGLGMESIACASRRRAIDSGGEQAADEESKRGSYAEKRGPQRREMKGLEAWLCTSNESLRLLAYSLS